MKENNVKENNVKEEKTVTLTRYELADVIGNHVVSNILEMVGDDMKAAIMFTSLIAIATRGVLDDLFGEEGEE